MRKDKGLNGDLDRLPLLTWIMFLKFLDDREKLEEARAGIGGKKYKAAIEVPYRWRDWAANKQGITGDELIAFINQDEATRPDGKRGQGMLAYLRGLQSTNGDRRRDVIATVFGGVINRMISGYLMRDMINLVGGIHFDSSEEMHTLARLYESMLREMRDAAGDSGEFYTPRPVIQFMVAVTDPRLGEIVLDPACGTGGFLAEAFSHLEKQCETVQERRALQEGSIRGGEAKPLPYMLAQMNLLLHGLDAPAIEYGNSLAVKLTELGDRDRVDVILTNPPFGGEEEAGIRGNFPSDKQTSETALLFLQLIMRKLRRPGAGANAAAGPASWFPTAPSSATASAARIKEELLKEFNLHTIVRLPNGVFAPYTSIPTNLLFFDRTGPTKDIWYYELPLPDGRKNYSKTKPIQFEEFAECIKWFQLKRRKETDHAWRVAAADVHKYDDWGARVVQPRHQEPQQRCGTGASAAGEARGRHPGQGTAHYRDHGRDQGRTGGRQYMSHKSSPRNSLVAAGDYEGILTGMVDLLEAARRASARAVNAIMTAAYWEVGRRIVECEQKGQNQAEYGTVLLKRLALDLTSRFGRGFSWRNLYLMRGFYLAYQEILQTPSAKLAQTLSAQFGQPEMSQTASDPLAGTGPQTIVQTPFEESSASGAIFQTLFWKISNLRDFAKTICEILVPGRKRPDSV